MNITLISGTNRPGSNTRHIVDHLNAAYQQLGYKPTVLDLTELPAEVFSPSIYAHKPAALARFTDAVLASDGFHIVTPEYNGGVPGVLKYFIDLLPFPESLERKPVALTGLSSGRWGALRPVEQLQTILAYLNAYVFPQRVFLAGVDEHMSKEGDITNSEWSERLRQQAAGFASFVRTLQAKAA